MNIHMKGKTTHHMKNKNNIALNNGKESIEDSKDVTSLANAALLEMKK